MNHFYRVAITKQFLGSAVEYKEPLFQGQIQAKVTDSTTQGNFKIIVVNCDDIQHQYNLNLSGVQNLAEDEVTKLAPLYQPERTIKRFDPKTRKEEQVVIPAADLSRFYSEIPSYEDYIIKSQVSEANMLFAGFKTEIMNFYSDRGSYPSLSELEDAGLVTSGTYVIGSYYLEGGYPVVRMTFSGAPEISGKSIEWVYQKNQDGQMEWSCRNSQTNGIPEKFLFKTCRQPVVDVG